MFELCHRFRLPLVLFGEGGGGRPGEDHIGPRVAIDTHTFTTFSQLQRARAAGRRGQRPHLRRQYRAGRRAATSIIATEGSTHRHGRPGDDRGRRPRHLYARGGRSDVGAGAEWRRRYPGQGRIRRGRCLRRSICPISRARSRPGRHTTSAGCASRAGEPPAPLQHARHHRNHRRQGLGAGDPREIRHRHHHRVHPGRRPADGRDRQQSAPPGRRHRLRRCRQGRALPAALRRLRHPRAQPDRLPGHHGRPRGRADRAGAPLRADVQRRAPT